MTCSRHPQREPKVRWGRSNFVIICALSLFFSPATAKVLFANSADHPLLQGLDTRIFIAGIGIDAGRVVYPHGCPDGDVFVPAPGSPHRRIKARALERARRVTRQLELVVGDPYKLCGGQQNLGQFIVTAQGELMQVADPSPPGKKTLHRIRITVIPRFNTTGSALVAAPKAVALPFGLAFHGVKDLDESLEGLKQNREPYGPKGYVLTKEQNLALTDLIRAIVAGVPAIAKARVYTTANAPGGNRRAMVVVEQTFIGLEDLVDKVLVPRAVIPKPPPRAQR